MSRPKHRADDGILWTLARFSWYLALAGITVVVWIGAQTTWSQEHPPAIEAPALKVAPAPATTTATPPPTPQPKAAPKAFEYASCKDASKAKALPLRKGERGYSLRLDTDRDGRACEAYHR